MTEDEGVVPPTPWTTRSLGDRNAVFVNAKRGLEVNVRAVNSRSRRSRGLDPSHYVVELRQDWFARGTLGDRETSAKAETWDEALGVAEAFMTEFTRELRTVPPDEVEATHHAVDDHDLADGMVTSAVAAEALADAAGYSDELLRSVLSAETNDQYLFVAHRERDTVTPVAGDASVLEGDVTLRTIHGVFPIDRAGIEHVLNESTPITLIVHLDRFAVYRFVAGDARETDVVLPRGTQVTSPMFERTVANVLEEKW